jgi:hypothetical protein
MPASPVSKNEESAVVMPMDPGTIAPSVQNCSRAHSAASRTSGESKATEKVPSSLFVSASPPACRM